MPIVLSCPICGTNFLVRPSYIKRRRYCTFACRDQARATMRTARQERREAADRKYKGLVTIYAISDASSKVIYVGITIAGREPNRLREHRI